MTSFPHFILSLVVEDEWAKQEAEDVREHEEAERVELRGMVQYIKNELYVMQQMLNQLEEQKYSFSKLSSPNGIVS